MDRAVLNVKKGQDIVIIIEGYEDHKASFDYDDVLQVILTQAQTDLNKRRSEKQRSQHGNSSANEKYYSAQTAEVASQHSYPIPGLYPRT